MMNPDTLGGALEDSWARWPDRPALVFGGGRMTYRQLGEAVKALARAYHGWGINRGDRVVSAVSNRPEKIIALGAAWTCGAAHVGVDYQFTGPELASVIELTRPKALLYEPHQLADPSEVIGALQRDHPDLRIIIVGDRAFAGDYATTSELIAANSAPETDKEDQSGPLPEDPALIFISSGTTGKPKATIGYQGNLAHRWRRLAAWLEFGPDDVHLAQLPLSHGFGLMMAMGALLSGGRLVLLDRFSAEEALHSVVAERVTVLNGAPAHFKLILNRLDPARHDVRSLRLSVGTAAFFPPSLVEAIWEKLGVKFMFMYGSSEGVGVATTDRDDILRGSVGRPAPGSATIVGPDHEPLPIGEVGEIAFSRDVYPVRYWTEATNGSQEPQGVEKQKESRWYYSGDLGRLDEEGRLYVFGRLKHQIDRGGLKVDPVEVESALLECPGVSDAAVIGLPNPVLGETVCACVVPANGQAPNLEELRAALGGRLAPYKLPEELCVLDRIPRTQLGKVDLQELRGRVEETRTQSLRNR